MNKQPWHFSVVTNKDVLSQIADGMGGGMPPASGGNGKPEGMPEMPEGMEKPEGMPMSDGGGAAKAGVGDAPVAVIISASERSDFDAGLACQDMSVTACLLGYGTKILTSPTMVLNGEKQAEYKELLGIPTDMSVVAVLLIGTADDSVDAVTTASERNPFDSTVTMIK